VEDLLRASFRRLTGGLVLGLALAGSLTTAPSQAAEGSPPVAVDDRARVVGGSFTELDLVANDTDPDGDKLAVCRIGDVPRSLHVQIENEGVFLIARRRVAGTFTFTYYACDFAHLTPATVTVRVTKATEIKVQKMPNRPGKLRVRNTADVPIVFMYGLFELDGPDGMIFMAARKAKFVSVRRHQIIWMAFAKRSGRPIDSGMVRNIRLPRGVRPLPSETDPAPDNSTSIILLAKAWSRHLAR
jgi:hypothetical protein